MAKKYKSLLVLLHLQMEILKANVKDEMPPKPLIGNEANTRFTTNQVLREILPCKNKKRAALPGTALSFTCLKLNCPS
jgi:hypothetical protein